MAQYKLVYFDGRGLGEIARYVFEAAGQTYEDVRVADQTWTDYKPKTPFGQIPVLEVHENDKVKLIAQSNTIARYLGAKFNFYGQTDLEKADVDSVLDFLNDIIGAYKNEGVYTEQDPAVKKEKHTKFCSTTLITYFGLLEKFLETNKTEFFAGSSLSIADFAVAIFVDRFQEGEAALFEKYPHVKAVVEKVNSHPKIASWRARRPQTAF